jgi:hypothetical protein
MAGPTQSPRPAAWAAVESTMVRFGRTPHDKNRPAKSDEDPVVRQYRFLLREASPDAVEAAHRDALLRLDEAQRRTVLAAVQTGLVAGQRLHPADTVQVAHLIVLGERRSPNAFVSACDEAALLALSQAVIHSEACFGLFGRYAAWDGADPEPEDQSAWADAGFNPDSGRWNIARNTHRNLDHGGGGGLQAGGGDGGGGG